MSCCSQIGTLFFSGVQLFRSKKVLWLPPAATYAWRTALEHGSAEQSAGSSNIPSPNFPLVGWERASSRASPPRPGCHQKSHELVGKTRDRSVVCLLSPEMKCLCLVLEHLGSKASLTQPAAWTCSPKREDGFWLVCSFRLLISYQLSSWWGVGAWCYWGTYSSVHVYANAFFLYWISGSHKP